MRLATWNVNSLKMRLPRLLPWLADKQPDVLLLQETKLADAAIPTAELKEAGYEVATHGAGQWNGVAILSKVGIEDVVRGFDKEPGFPDPEARAISATCGGVRVWSVYVPNGREPDSPHYEYKLRWLAALRDALAADLAAGSDQSGAGRGATGPDWAGSRSQSERSEPASRATRRPVVVAGDFNVAPTDADVWDPKAFVGSTHVTAPERDALAQILAAGFTDVVPTPMKGPHPFTYWDYRAGMFHKNLGMRIDLVYASAGVTVESAYIDREARKGKGPSDHAPVVVELS
ncbi:exodeoxyribonuclease III [Phytohabitans houttuyneae]|uniref:Exodeoxyribonuclease III n=1 Tax=Phytohabitans houttuyneae TaxID=1076126 RepID=A0A6V8JXT4_9ACTN|nr:exodeoxyribonuclease III [Phytohabitans houttuyneae]GFJ77542.1 exodeoxyribonuclease III [Phytohabitans houttuyneae]